MPIRRLDDACRPATKPLYLLAGRKKLRDIKDFPGMKKRYCPHRQ
jgi:hypothetical protein